MWRQLVVERLKEQGWSEREGPAVASRMFATAVGEKEAFVYLSSCGNDHLLQGDYYSEGRNILESSSAAIGAGCDRLKVIALVDKFVRDAEAAISESYAVRLLRLGN